MLASYPKSIVEIPSGVGLLLTFSIAIVGCGSSRAPNGGSANTFGSHARPAPPNEDPRGWRAAASLNVARMAHTATLLRDGTVLVVGGEMLKDREMLAAVERFDPRQKTWSLLAPLARPRSNHVAVELKDGRVLVAGGGRSAPIGQPSGREVTASAALYDPGTGRFEETAPLGAARSHFQAVLLRSGEVLVAGGGSASSHQSCGGVPNCGPIADPLSSVERFDPKTGSWRGAAPMHDARYSFSLTLLADGRVLAVGGVGVPRGALSGLKSAEIYDPKTDAWTMASTLPDVDREHHRALLLSNGDVMVAGGKQANVGMLKSTLVFSPSRGAWRSGPAFATARTIPELVLLPSSHMLSVGGYNQANDEELDEALLYDEPADRWSKIGSLADGRLGHTTTVLIDGSVLVVGGLANSIGAETKTCEQSTAIP